MKAYQRPSLDTTQIEVGHAVPIFNTGSKALLSVMKECRRDTGPLCSATYHVLMNVQDCHKNTMYHLGIPLSHVEQVGLTPSIALSHLYSHMDSHYPMKNRWD